MNRDKNTQDSHSSSSEQRLNPKTNAKWNEFEEAIAKERKEEELLESIISTSTGVNVEETEGDATCKWVQSSSRENYYTIDPACQSENSTVAATQSLKDLLAKFKRDILDKCSEAKAVQPKHEIPSWGHHSHHHHHHHHQSDESSSSDSDSSEDEDEEEEESKETTDAATILKIKEDHPARLAENLWYNDKGQLNDRPACRCSVKSQKVGIRHNIYPGEKPYPICDPFTNNLKALHHYVIEISPSTNFISPSPTVIKYDDREFIFEGLSLFSHVPVDDVPPCHVVRFGIEYRLSVVKQDPLENFVVQELDYFSDFLFTEILELYDFDYSDRQGGCRRFHFMPRFARLLPNKGREILSMHQVMSYLLNSHKPVIAEDKLADILKLDGIKWSRFLDFIKSMIVIAPGKKPSSVRVDQIDRDQSVCTKTEKRFPLVIHAGARPAQLLYITDPEYRKLHKQYLRMRHLLHNRKSHEDQQSYINIQNELARIRKEAYQSKEVTSEIDSSQIFITGIRSDICQHALIMPVLIIHVRYFLCLDKLNEKLGNIFTSKILLKRAMTHPSYRLTFGMNSDHIRNSIFNCGFRRPETGDKTWRQMETRKRGIVNLVKIMSRLAEEEEVQSNIHHYERLEFLGDAVVEFITSTTLYHLFPNVEEGGLAVYRQALVENQHLAKLARKLELGSFMLYAHGQDLCRDQDLRHAEANCLEALLGAIYLDCGIEVARKVFCQLLFEDEVLSKIWIEYPKHPLQLQLPEGDRHMIPDSPVLQNIVKFEEITGIRFKHIRLLARAFTHRTVGFTDLTLGHNQRMEFLGDSVMQLVVSEYLYKHFPEHHEGHLSLLRSSLVNNKTQAIVCQDLGLEDYIVDVTVSRFARKGFPVKMQADLLEALVGAMYVDRGLEAVEVFCNVCIFPRLREFIIEQDWNDDKSKLQQVVLTLRKIGEAPDIPQYKLLKRSGPTNATMFTVAVFFRNERIGKGTADSVRAAEKMAAKDALQKGHYEQIKFQTKLMSSLYPDEYHPPEMGKRRPREEKKPLPKQYALESTRNRRKDGGKEDRAGRSVS